MLCFLTCVLWHVFWDVLIFLTYNRTVWLTIYSDMYSDVVPTVLHPFCHFGWLVLFEVLSGIYSDMLHFDLFSSMSLRFCLTHNRAFSLTYFLPFVEGFLDFWLVASDTWSDAWHGDLRNVAWHLAWHIFWHFVRHILWHLPWHPAYYILMCWAWGFKWIHRVGK